MGIVTGLRGTWLLQQFAYTLLELVDLYFYRNANNMLR